MPKIILNKRLNIFVDETGEFGFAKGSAKLYGVSFVFHEQSMDISKELDALNERFGYLGFNAMVHMGDLVSGHEDFEGMEIEERRKIYVQLYRFAVKIPAIYYSFFIDKNIYSTSRELNDMITKSIQELVLDKLEYFQGFDEIKMYYDGGQRQLGKIIDEVFGGLSGYERKSNFDHLEKKLFQVADMLTYVDKIIYKRNNGIKFSNTEKAFYDYRTIERIRRELSRKRFR